jgi:putative endonuclease
VSARAHAAEGETHPEGNGIRVSEDAGAWVYMLRCRDGSLYTGWTVDLERRLGRHRAGTGSRYTRSRLPVVLAFAVPMSDRTAARREEARIKRLSRAGKLALLRAGDVPPQAA